ncbi:MAG: hypothetical protein ACON4N_13370 [Myxococcota bacterium]
MRVGWILILGIMGCDPMAYLARWTSSTPPAEHYIVWDMPSDEQGGYRSTWVVVNAGVAKAAGHREGLVVAAGDGFVVGETVIKTRPFVDCEGQPSSASTAVWAMRRWSADGMMSEAVVDLFEEPEWLVSEEGGFDYDEGLGVTGSVGPWLFLTGSTSEYFCGAHGGSQAGSAVVDLRTLAVADPYTDEETNQVDAALRPTAFDVLKSDEGESFVTEPSEMAWTESRPEWGDGTLSMRVQFTGDACYACSDGEWSSYTVSHALSSSVVPAALREGAVWPEALKAEWPAPKEGWKRGFSRVEAKGDAALALQATFLQ